MAEPDTDTPPVREPSEVIYDSTGKITPGTQGQQARGETPLKSPLAPPTPAESAARYATESEAVERRQEEQFRQHQKEKQPLYSELEAVDRSPRPAVPHLQNVGPPPDQREYQKYAMGYMAAMSVLMAFSGRLAGRSGTESLTAFAGAAEGWQTGNQQAYENGHKQWEASNKRLLQQNENQLKEYDLILKDRSLKREDIIDRLKIAAIKNYDDQTYNDLVKGNLEKAYQRRDIVWKATNDLQTALAPYRQGQAKHNAEMVDRANKYAEMEENNWVNPATGQPYINSNTKQPYTDTEKATAKHFLERVPAGSTVDAEGNIKYPGTGGARMSEFQQWLMQNPGGTMEQYWKAKAQSRPPRNAPAMFMQKYIEEHPEAKSTDIRNAMAIYNMTQSRMRTLGTREANIDVAINEGVRTAKLALAASDKVPRGDFVSINELKEKIRRGTSSKEQQVFDDANSAFITAYAQTMSRTGATTVHAQERAERVLRTATGPEAYKAGVEFLITEMQTVKAAVKDALEDMEGTGAPAAPGGGGGSLPPVGGDSAGGSSAFKGKTDAEVLEAAGLGSK